MMSWTIDLETLAWLGVHATSTCSLVAQSVACALVAVYGGVGVIVLLCSVSSAHHRPKARSSAAFARPSTGAVYIKDAAQVRDDALIGHHPDDLCSRPTPAEIMHHPQQQQQLRSAHHSLQRMSRGRSPQMSVAMEQQARSVAAAPYPQDDCAVVWLGRYPNSFVTHSHIVPASPRNYELSDEIQQKQIEMLERKYGGRLRAQRAASIVQRAFREYSLAKRWKQVRSQQQPRRHKPAAQWPIANHHRLPPRFDSAYHRSQSPHMHSSHSALLSPQLVRQSPRPPAVSVSASSPVPIRSLQHNGFVNHQTQQQQSDSMLLRYGHHAPIPAPLHLHRYNVGGGAAAASWSSRPTLQTSLTAQLKAEQATSNSPRVAPKASSRSRVVHRAAEDDRASAASGGGPPSVRVSSSTRATSLERKRGQNVSAPQILSHHAEILRNYHPPAAAYQAVDADYAAYARPTAYDPTTPVDADLPSYLTYAQLMSPRMRQKRPAHSPNDDVSPHGPQSPARSAVWVPRVEPEASSSNAVVAAADHSHHSNSLPRLDKQLKRTASDGGSGRTAAAAASALLSARTSEQERRRQYRIALNFFNKKPERGMRFLINFGFVEGTPLAVAKFLISRRGLSKQMIGEFLGNVQNPFHSAVLECFVDEIDFRDMDVDVALRHFLGYFRLPGEAQKIERVMEVFAHRYCECNVERAVHFRHQDTVFILAFAVVMLNTDLHSPNIKEERRMKLDDFVKNLKGIDKGHDVDRLLLVGIYNRVKEQEFRSGSDHVAQVVKVDRSITGKDKPKLAVAHRRLVCYCRLHEVTDPNKKQPTNAHQREIFLFNDMIVVTKIQSRKKTGVMYSYRCSMNLGGMQVHSFHTAHYPHGLRLTNALDNKALLFNARNEEDRRKFAEDLREAIAESDEMETLRIELELEKQSLVRPSAGVSPLSRVDSQRDSGLPDLADDATLKPMHRALSSSLLDLADPSAGAALANVAEASHSIRTAAVAARRASLNSLDSGMSSTASVESRESPPKTPAAAK
uniref:SEC7 domain-containing protein n=2 Tax=Plectus sambesii TaxID=2011161 RepID=A0A914W5H5_9BILA